MTPRTDTGFVVPPENIPTAPPERRGLARDGVRLLVARADGIVDTTFADLGQYLSSADIIVVNTSATRPAALRGCTESGVVGVHFSTRAGRDCWVVELRLPDGSGPLLDARTGQIADLAGEGHLRLLAPQAAGPDGRGTRLWQARVVVPSGRVGRHLRRHGRPITYGVDAPVWPLEDYQTVFARHDGSAEMPSAARPFSLRLVADLVSRGVALVPLQLHAGVSSQVAGEPPQPERYSVPARTAALVNHARQAGGRVIAVGTTVTRALETVADDTGMVRPGRGITGLVVHQSRGVRVVDGLITGWHEADASHLHLLRAVAGDLVDPAYRHALAGGYAWHEFGDSALFLPDGRSGHG